MIARLMRTVKKVRPWMVAVALAGGAAWASSCDSGSSTCEPGEFYGPATCTTDEECVTRNAAGWTCEATPRSYDDGCGHSIEWGRICIPPGSADADADADADVGPDADADAPVDGGADCVPAVFYGPDPVCTDEAQCVSEHGAGWTCTGYTTYPDTCGGTINWGPTCEPPGGADADADTGDGAVYYGPPPVDADANADDTPSTAYGPPPVDGGTDVASDTPPAYYGPVTVDAAETTPDDVPATFYGPTPAGSP